MIFTCARVSHALLSLRKNRGPLVVYSLIKMTGIPIGKLELNPREIILGVASIRNVAQKLPSIDSLIWTPYVIYFISFYLFRHSYLSYSG